MSYTSHLHLDLVDAVRASVVETFGFPAFVGIRLVSSLLLTVAVELPVARRLGFRSRREQAAVAWVNVLTNPLLVIALLALDARFVNRNAALFWPVALVLEGLVVLVEWPLLSWATGRPQRKTLEVAVKMNVASFFVGLFFWVALWFLALGVINSTWTPGG